MASLDPRKAESITNQPNYLMTIATTSIGGLVTSAAASGVWNTTAFVVVGSLWVIAFAAQEIRKLVRYYTRGPEQSSTNSEPTRPDDSRPY